MECGKEVGGCGRGVHDPTQEVRDAGWCKIPRYVTNIPQNTARPAPRVFPDGYYAVVRATGGKSEELSRLADQVLIGALSVPAGHASGEDEVKGRTARLTALLGLTKTPTRTVLLKEAVSIPANTEWLSSLNDSFSI